MGKKKRIEELEEIASKKHSQWGDVFRRLFHNRLAMIGLAIILILIFLAVFANVLTPYDPNEMDYANRLQYSSAAHWLGTDNYGRDLLTRLIYGARTSLLVSIIALIISNIIGLVIGGVSGFFGGWRDTMMMRILDIIMAIPGILLAVCICSLLGSGIFNTALAISISAVPGAARIIRSSILSVREEEFVEAAIATGSTRMRALFRHVLPNTLGPLIVNASMQVGNAILAISGLAFVGLGVAAPTAEWGAIMSSGREFLRSFWPLATYPGIFIMLTLFGFNVFGDGMRDALDPKLKK